MIHVLWVGLVIAMVLAIARHLLRSSSPEARYAVALVGLFAFASAPPAIFKVIYQPVGPVSTVEVAPTSTRTTGLTAPESSTADLSLPRPLPGLDREPSTAEFSARNWLDRLVPLLPWFWLAGSLLSVAGLATGLVGVERLRRSSVSIADGEVARLCRNLARSMRVRGRVAVSTSRRLAGPVLLGILRPLILLPATALDAWTIDEIEMALVHELAHLRRWDNAVNLLQRLVESVLFFHPAAWWLSRWIRLERELCCDRIVIERTGRRSAYAEMLANLAMGNQRTLPGMGMADRQVATRIRRILNLENKERSMTLKSRMNLTFPEGFGLIGAAVIGLGLAIAAHAGPLEDHFRLELRKAAADASKVDPGEENAENGDSRGLALLNIAGAQARIGDHEGALETLGKVVDPKADDPGQSERLLQVAEVRREVGDPLGARSTLDRVAAIAEGMKVDPLKQAKVVKNQALGGYVEEESPAMVQAELFAAIAEQRAKLGDKEEAKALLRKAISAMEKQVGPTKYYILGTIAVELAEAGVRDEAIAAIDRWVIEADAMKEPGYREESIGVLAMALAELGEFDRVIVLFKDHPSEEILFQVIEGLVENDPKGQDADPDGVKLFGSGRVVRLKNRDSARPALVKLAEAARSVESPMGRAMLLATIAPLQAMAGDLTSARASAEAIPDIHKADVQAQDAGMTGGVFEAIKPTTLAFVARYLDRVEAGQLRDRASTIARAIEAEDQAIFARVGVAREYARASQPGEARALLLEAGPIARKQPEPRRSRALGAIVIAQAMADDIPSATANAQLIREWPGLEKQGALEALANWHEKAGNPEAAQKVWRQALANAEAKGPVDPQVAKVDDQVNVVTMDPSMVVGRLDGLDRPAPDVESDPMIVQFFRQSKPYEIRVKLGDLDGALRLAREQSDPILRDIHLATIVGLLAKRGEIQRAFEIASTIESAEQRMDALNWITQHIKPR
jgi:beta-lactamase regulating signal transducer with metallopeptidase domain